jgi:hypothetical protein
MNASSKAQRQARHKGLEDVFAPRLNSVEPDAGEFSNSSAIRQLDFSWNWRVTILGALKLDDGSKAEHMPWNRLSRASVFNKVWYDRVGCFADITLMV